MSKRARYLRMGREGTEPHYANPMEFVERSESEEARRQMRDWLRERTEDDIPEFEIPDC